MGPINRYFDERDLQRKIAKALSQPPFHFRVMSANHWCDVADELHNIFIEVKRDGKFAPAQLLYGSVRGVNEPLNYKPQYFGLANENEVRFYKVPPFEVVKEFAREIDPEEKISPSHVPHKFNSRAFEILGEPVHINDYQSPLELEQPYVFITLQNIYWVRQLLQKYRIDLRSFISAFSDVWINNGEIIPLKKGGLTDTVNGSTVEGRPIRNRQDLQIITRLRITPEDLEKIRRILDEFEDIESRREFGKYYTKPETAEEAHEIITTVFGEPDFIIEPFAGTGSLLIPFNERIPILANDIDADAIEITKILLEGRDLRTDTLDLIGQWAIGDVFYNLARRWNLDEIKEKHVNILVYSNPPFGSVSTNKLAGRHGRRTIKINIHPSLEKYGKGDLLIPSIGQMLEIAKYVSGNLAFYSPFGIFLWRKRYQKLMMQLIENANFVYGRVFRGTDFNSVTQDKPISLSLWSLEKIEPPIKPQKAIRLRKENNEWFLLKKGWNYDTRIGEGSIISAPHRNIFNDPQGGFLHINPKAGGSQLIPENVKIDIGFEEVPAELIYGLWSVLVGTRGVADTPYYFDNAYTHIPRTLEDDERKQIILTLGVLWVLIDENLNRRTNGLIGFTSTYKRLKFGTPRTTRGAQYLLDKFEDLILGYHPETAAPVTVKDFVEILKKNHLDTQGYKPYRKMIRDMLNALLNEIGYWDAIIIDKDAPDILETWEFEIS